MRLDIWIWVSRMAKTRSKASSLCKAGKVAVNEQTAKASRSVKINDIVSVQYPGLLKVYRVKGFTDKRGSASEAALLFEDLSPEPEKADISRYIPTAIRSKGSGRPTKKERRRIESFTKGEE